MMDLRIVVLPMIKLPDHAPHIPIFRGDGARVTAHERRLLAFVPATRQCSALKSSRPPWRPCVVPSYVGKAVPAMKATIHHNPNCGTSRKTLEILRESGAEVTVNEYLKSPPRREELRRLYERAGIRPRDGLRAKEPLAAELGLTAGDVSDEQVLDAMMQHPILINRPLVETEKGVRLCRPQETVREIL
jgi:arsenate reductase